MGDQELFILIVISIIVMIILSLGVIVLYNVSQSRILKEVEASYQKEVDHKNRLIANTIATQENERERIAKDLHDDIGSKLSVVNLNLNLLKSILPDEIRDGEIVDQIETTLNESITRARDISHNLYPSILEKFGLHSAIESLVNQVNKTGAISIELDISHEWKSFSKLEELHLYRIIQELVHNTIKHANARHVWIKSSSKDQHMEISYQDDGKGIDNKVSMDGLGMSSIQTRINLVNGNFEILPTHEGFKALITL